MGTPTEGEVPEGRLQEEQVDTLEAVVLLLRNLLVGTLSAQEDHRLLHLVLVAWLSLV
jgi:hypothetical protein